jgi:hypothetical protein
MCAMALTVTLPLMLTAAVAAQAQSLEDLKTWFESEAAAIMREPAVQRIGAYNAGVKNVRLNGCDLSWTTDNGSFVQVRLKSIDPQSIHLQTSKLLEVRTVVSLEMAVRENGEPVTAEKGDAFSEMTRLSVLVRNQTDGERLLASTRRAVALCQVITGKP